MSKFKVGDRVRRVGGAGTRGHGSKIGDEVVVVAPRNWVPNAVWYKNSDGDSVWSDAKNWELAPTSPVVVVTEKKIVQGKFGPVAVKGVFANAVMLDFAPSDDLHWHANELTAAIETLTAIRDALVEAA